MTTLKVLTLVHVEQALFGPSLSPFVWFHCANAQVQVPVVQMNKHWDVLIQHSGSVLVQD